MIIFYERYFFTVVFYISVSMCMLSCNPDVTMIKEGDVVFQNLSSASNQTMQTLTHSEWNQCGVVLSDSGGNLVVLEVTDQVKEIPLKEWVKKGEQKKFAVFRIKNSENILTKGILSKMKKITSTFMGKKEDDLFSWNDEKLYSSELIYKVYFLTTGIKLTETKPMKELDWSNEKRIQKFQEAYQEKILMNEPVVTPQQLIESSWLRKIHAN